MAEKSVSAGTVTVGDSKVKMIKVHSEFQEADVAAAQNDADENRFAGPNPYPAGTARAQGWDYLKKMTK